MLMPLLFLLALLFLALALLGIYGARELLRRRPPDVQASPADYGLPYEEVSFPSRDGLILKGWFIPAPQPKGTVIFCHGHQGSMDPDLRYVPAFHQRGYNVLMFDFRGHGRSQGQYVSMGYFERLDLLGAVDYLRSRGIEKVGVLGFSMGGAVAISAAPQSEAIRAVVSDGGFARLEPTIAAGARERGLPTPLAYLMAKMTLLMADLFLRARLEKADPLRWVGKLAPRALLIIHGGLDPYVSVAEVQALYRAAGEPKELWLVPEAGHRAVDEARPDEYLERILGFFDRWL